MISICKQIGFCEFLNEVVCTRTGKKQTYLSKTLAIYIQTQLREGFKEPLTIKEYAPSYQHGFYVYATTFDDDIAATPNVLSCFN